MMVSSIQWFSQSFQNSKGSFQNYKNVDPALAGGYVKLEELAIEHRFIDLKSIKLHDFILNLAKMLPVPKNVVKPLLIQNTKKQMILLIVNGV